MSTTGNSDTKNLENTMAGVAVQSQTALRAGLKSSTGEYDELLEVNQLNFAVPPSLSVVSKRTMIQNNFMQTSYLNQPQNTTMTLIFNTGEFYVQAATSFIQIEIGIDSTVGTTDLDIAGDTVVGTTEPVRTDPELAYDIPDGNVLSIVEEVVLTTASGTEVCREQKKGLNSTASFPFMYGDEYKSSIGTGEGYSWKASQYDGSYRTWPPGQKSLPVGGRNQRNFNCQTADGVFQRGIVLFIPLTQLAGVFNPYNKALIPASLLSGGRLDIRLSDPRLVFRARGTDATPNNVAAISADLANNYKVKNIALMLDCFQLGDGVLKRLNEISAGATGLNFLFDTYDWSQTNTTQASVECQVSQARSRIINSFCVVQLPGFFTNPYADKLASEAAIRRVSGYQQLLHPENVTVTNYQAILGSLYFPQQPLTSFRDYLENSYYIWNKSLTDCERNSDVADEDFAGADGNMMTTAVPDFTGNNRGVYPVGGYVADTTPLSAMWQPNYGRAIYGMTAERSSYLQLSGIPISNARLLRHRFNFATATTRQISIFTSFSRIVRVYLGGRVLVRE